MFDASKRKHNPSLLVSLRCCCCSSTLKANANTTKGLQYASGCIIKINIGQTVGGVPSQPNSGHSQAHKMSKQQEQLNDMLHFFHFKYFKIPFKVKLCYSGKWHYIVLLGCCLFARFVRCLASYMVAGWLQELYFLTLLHSTSSKAYIPHNFTARLSRKPHLPPLVVI